MTDLPDIYAILEQQRKIANIWGVEDVQEVRPDLTDDQAWEVLQECLDRLDCTVGLCWDTLEWVAHDLFPSPDE